MIVPAKEPPKYARKLVRTCGHCGGCGTIEVTGEYRATMELLLTKFMLSFVTGAYLAKVMGIKPTAMNNRLSQLEKMGLVRSRRHGRNRLYTADFKNIKTKQVPR
jgi:DNA-binding transcriptional ArsR family regulator